MIKKAELEKASKSKHNPRLESFRHARDCLIRPSRQISRIKSPIEFDDTIRFRYVISARYRYQEVQLKVSAIKIESLGPSRHLIVKSIHM